jgi:hypothetical protein
MPQKKLLSWPIVKVLPSSTRPSQDRDASVSITVLNELQEIGKNRGLRKGGDK